jgi:PepSY-associated transmembrane protein
MTRALILLHRWLGVTFCLFFAMWFATGIVMHFVPFPALTETERFAGLAPIDVRAIRHSPAEAVAASALKDAERVRLQQRSDAPIYLVTGPSGLKALSAADLSSAAVTSEQLALAIALDHARRRGLDASHATVAELAHYDQWTVPNGLDPHRPLYRIALRDGRGTELYVSSTTGEVVRDTTRAERWWNYAGSVPHWIYPTALRSHWAAWDRTVWWLSLIAATAAITGAVLGVLRLKFTQRRLTSPYRGWHAWHHWLGLGSSIFVLTWIVSGWLSMDHGRLFSLDKLSELETKAVTGAPAWDALSADELKRLSAQAREIEWFPFGGQNHRRERIVLGVQHLFVAGAGDTTRAFLAADDVSAIAPKLAPPGCYAAVPIGANDSYSIDPTMPGAPVYRLVCGDVWYHIDGASGAALEKLDSSRRAYRWFYSALHTLDIPVLMEAPGVRTVLIIALCALGLAFSLSGVVIGWRRLRVSSTRRL